MKKIIISILSTIILVTLSACGDATKETSETTQPTTTAEETEAPTTTEETEAPTTTKEEETTELDLSALAEGDTALIIVGAQNDYFEGGAQTLHNSAEALSNIETILKKFREDGLPVIHIKQIDGEDADYLQSGTPGADIHENLKPLENEIVLEKNEPNSFKGTKLALILNEGGYKNLVFAGMQTDVDVDGTIKAADGMCYMIDNMTLLEDACAAIDQDTQDKAIEGFGKYGKGNIDFKVIKTSEYE